MSLAGLAFSGMAFEIRQTYPTDWSADGRYYWTW
jgi:hypothetical protein